MLENAAEVNQYFLPPTHLIPNSHLPLLHYRNILPPSTCSPAQVYDTLASNDWEMQWIFRYGPTQQSHYHSSAHECMAVLSGEATIRFGVADTATDLEENTHGNGHEHGGIEVKAKAGDVFVLPAGLAHKTFDTFPVNSFALLTAGDGHHLSAEYPRRDLEHLELSGFTMLGAYPRGGQWDFAVGGEHEGRYANVWAVPVPERDPILGLDERGLKGLWKAEASKS